MYNLVIIGARGFGREVCNLARRCAETGASFAIKGFLDDKTDALDGFAGYPPILGPVETYAIQPGDRFICALGSVVYRRKYAELILGRGGVFASLIDPTAVVFSNTLIGQGVAVFNYATVSCDVCVGDHAAILCCAALGHDAKVGRFCHLGAYAFLGGGADVADDVTLHTGARIMPHKRVGVGATVGVNSVVMRNVKPGITVFGNPALPL